MQKRLKKIYRKTVPNALAGPISSIYRKLNNPNPKVPIHEAQILDELEAFFVHLPRTGGTSVEQMLRPLTQKDPLFGHTTAAGRAVSAHTLLLWQAADWLASKGHDRLDLGLINTEDAPGLARFKLGAGACARPLGGTWIWWPPLGRTLRPLAALDRRLMRALS